MEHETDLIHMAMPKLTLFHRQRLERFAGDDVLNGSQLCRSRPVGVDGALRHVRGNDGAVVGGRYLLGGVAGDEVEAIQEEDSAFRHCAPEWEICMADRSEAC
jgi:hypothetical protein